MIVNKTDVVITMTWGRFPFGRGALFLLSLSYRTEQSLLGASEEPLHSRCSLQGLRPRRCWSRRRYHRTWCF